MTTRWKIARSVTVVSVLVAALSMTGVGQTAAPGMGSWTLNLAKSTFSPGPAPKSATVTFSAAGDGVKAVIDTVGATGSKAHWEYTASFDGKPHPVTGNPDGDMVIIKRINAMTVESSYTLKGKPTTINTRVVSADGKTTTVTSKGMNAQGQKVDNVQVYERS